MISRKEFDAYNLEVARLGDEAASNVEESIMGWCRAHGDATVAERREAAKVIMDGFVQAYDEEAARFAADWYDYRAELGGARLDQALTMTTTAQSPSTMSRYQAKKRRRATRPSRRPAASTPGTTCSEA